jgi:PBSX family phage portal protein
MRKRLDTVTESNETKRHVTVVSDDTPDVPTIDHVGMLTFTTSSENHDAFAKSADEIRTFDGISTNNKRRITNKLSKARTGAGGAESTQVIDDSFNGYQIFDVVEPPYSLDYLAKLYEINPTHYAAVNAKVSNIVGLGYNFVESYKTKRALENSKKQQKLQQTLADHKNELEQQLKSFNKEDTLTEVFIKVWRDYETTGNGYIEIGRKKDKTIGYIGHIPSQTIRIRKPRDGFVQLSGQKAVFFANFGAGTDDDGKPQIVRDPVNGGTGPNEIIHIKKYSPTSGYYGIPDIVAAKQAVAGNEFAARYNLDYFENKAMPRYVILLKGAKLGQTAESKLLQFFESNLKGQNQRTVFIPLPPDTPNGQVEMKFEQVGPDIQDSSFTNYRSANIDDILTAHRVPITKVSVADAASLAIAKDADKTFKEQVCAPEQSIFEAKVARIIEELTDAFDLKFNEMTLTDEETQAKIDDLYIKNGTDLSNEVRSRRGLGPVPGGDTRVELNKPQPTAAAQNADANANRARDTTRQTNSTDSSGNARNPKGDGRTTP